MSDRVRVTIDGTSVDVPRGTLVTEAARLAGIHVPVFCSHSKLPPLGACRICVVEVGTPKLDAHRQPVLAADGAPEIAWLPKVQTGCTTPVSDGMHVRTATPVAEKARKGVMEFLLVNHPLDCPVCDEGGECQLQDLAFAFGADASRMNDHKRTFDSEDLGPIVKKEANRCIVCLRCVRYCDEVMGEDALTAHQRGVRTEISSFNRQPLECEQCGNCVEVCPVGALTALPYRFKARPWDLRQHITICPWCSNGCSVRVGVRGREILRARGTEYRGINGEYLCVRGRFGYEFVGDGDRLSVPLLRLGAELSPSTWEESVAFVAARLREIDARHGAGAVAFLGGERLNLEEQYLFGKLARQVLRTNHIDARTRLNAPVGGGAILRATGGGRTLLPFDALGAAEEVLVLAEDLQGESPFVQATLIRGQHQRGLHVTVAHARRVKLARPKFKGDWLALRPGGELALLHGLTLAALTAGGGAGVASEVEEALAALPRALAAWTPQRVEAESGVSWSAIEAAARRLSGARRKAVLFGRGIVEHPQAAALLQAIENLGWASGAIDAGRSCVLYLGPHHDSQGALDMGLVPDRLPGHGDLQDAQARRAFEQQWGGALPTSPGLAAPEILRAAADGRIRALWIAGDDWLRSAPDRALVEKALATVDLLVVNEMFLTGTARRAHAVFPVAAFAEKEGVVVNAERRVQRALRALSPHRGTLPDLEVFQRVAQALGANWRYRTAEDVFREIARLVPGYEGLHGAALLPLGPQTSGAARVPAEIAAPADPGAAGGDGMWLLTGGVLFAQGSLSARAATLARLRGPARAHLNPGDASRLGLADGVGIELSTAAGALRLPALADDSVPAGAVFVPYAHPDVELNRLGAPGGAGLRVQLRRSQGAAVPGGARA